MTNAGGVTLVTNAGSNGKFLAVLDLEIAKGKVSNVRYRLLPVFSELLKPDPAMQALIERTARRMRRCWTKSSRPPIACSIAAAISAAARTN